MQFAHKTFAAFLFIIAACAPSTHAQQFSALWGEHGEKWSPKSRLPDFSFAGYHSGEDKLPTVKVVANVRDFGAKGDGEKDDTQAFLSAIKATDSGAVMIPEGRYKITQILSIEKPHVVLRGAGPDKTILFFPKSLEDLRAAPTTNPAKRPISEYSWSGGLAWIKGDYQGATIGPIVTQPLRGDRDVELEAPAAGLAVGDRVAIEQRDDEQKTLLTYLYSGDPGDVKKITTPMTVRFVSRVAAIHGTTVTLERPLRYDIRKTWQPVLRRFESTVYESGIEDLAIAFPNTPYTGHFTEVGNNGIAINGALDCWVRNVHLQNCDSGIFCGGLFCTVDGVVIESKRTAKDGTTGHHGITGNTDCIVTNFDINTRFIHDLSVELLTAGAVFKNGKGVDLALDHHKRAPHENLFSNLDLGEGSVTWRSGGDTSLGKHSAARGTFWNLRAIRNQTLPPENFGPDSMNFIGLQTDQKSILEPDGKWFETVAPAQLQPVELHAAQLKRRLESH